MGVVEFFSSRLEIIGFIITIFAIFLTIYFYYKSKKSKKPFYAILNFNLVTNLVSKFESLQICYGSDDIVNLSACKIAFWNEGNDTIDKNDVAPSDPIIFKLDPDCKILDAKILYEKNPVNRFSIDISPDKTSIQVSFDYIDQNEGVIIQLLHTGVNATNIKFQGSIKGVKKINCTTNTKSNALLSRMIIRILPDKTYKLKRIFGYFSFIVSLVILGVILIIPRGIESPFDFIFVAVMLVPYWFMAYTLLKRRVPSGFEIFEDEII